MTKRKLLLLGILICIFINGCVIRENSYGYKNTDKKEEKYDLKNITDNYLNKIWIGENIKDKTESYPVIYFEKIGGNIVEGLISPSIYEILPGEYRLVNGNVVSSDDWNPCKFSGTIEENEVSCDFEYHSSQRKNVKGKLVLTFEPSGELIGELECQTIIQDNCRMEGGKYLFSPYNQNTDLYKEETEKYKDSILDIGKVESWGEVKLLNRNSISNQVGTNVYLIDVDGNILYSFGDFPMGVRVREVSYEDINKDNKKDFIMIYEGVGEEGEGIGNAKIYCYAGEKRFLEKKKLEQMVNKELGNCTISRVHDFIKERIK